MKNSTKTLLGAAGLVGLFACNAYADDAPAAPAPDWVLTGTLDVQSDYKFRGISQNERDPSPQGALTLSGPDGFYVSSWASTINWQLDGVDGNPGVEWDIYGGKHTDLWGTDLNVEAYYYAYPDAETFGGSKASYFEAITQLTHAFGPLSVQATWAWSPEFSLGGGTGNWLAGNATYTVLDWLTVSGNVGHQWVQAAKYFGSSDYTEWDLGATATWKMFSLDLRYIDTDLSKGSCANFYMPTKDACEGNFVATLNYNFTLWP
ncbi:MAG TPA: TorF family putative porin [Rhizomicrobium sp.]|jgi:uncharacterized protein (TIGR02001 family)|nr:TorF family putative porin [Rhizomicrobium sp.]